jgi:curved DNA-binding protein CbpA
MNGIDIDPYKILGIPNDSTLEQVKEAYRILARKHHPDKGGNADTFKIMKTAFKIIVDNIKKGVPIPKTQVSTFNELKDGSTNFQVTKQLEPHEFFGHAKPINVNKEFNANAFNQKFISGKNNGEDYLLASSDNDYRENRTKEQLLSEQAAIDGEIGKIKPMFVGKDWSNNAFNRMFEHINGKPEDKITALQGYEEPIALTSGLQPFTEIDDNHKLKQTGNIVSLPFGSLDDSFAGYKNPNAIDNDLLTKFKQQPDITNVNTIEGDYGSKMKNKLNQYRNAQFNFHAPPANPNQLPEQLMSTKSGIDKISQKGLNDVYSQKLSERNQMTNQLRYGGNGNGNGDTSNGDRVTSNKAKPNVINDRNLPINNQHHAMPVMDYPRNSNNSGNTSFTPTVPIPQKMPQLSQVTNNSNQSNSSDDYFMKIPNTGTNTYNANFNPYTQPMPSQNYNNNFNQVEMIQKQLMDLQKTVEQQNQLIKNLKKPKGNKPNIKN